MFYQIPSSLRKDFEIAISKKRMAKTVKGKPWHLRCISNFDDVKLACVELYKKGTLFAQGKRLGGTISRRSYNCPAIDAVLDNLAKRIWECFNKIPNTPNTREDFDEFHNDLCRMFIEEYNAVAPTLPGATYGNAQKIVNMVFKYLTCYSDYDKFADLFSHCHMPIDANILYELKHIYSLNNIHKSFKTKTGYTGYYIYSGVDYSWSHLTEDAYSQLLRDYRDAIDHTLVDADGNRHTYLELEYYLWDAAVKGVTFTGIPVGGTLAKPIKEFHK